MGPATESTKHALVKDLFQDNTCWSRVQAEVCLPPTGVNAGSLAAWVIWSLWITRNYRIFQDKTFMEQEVVTKAIVDGKEWSAAQPLKPDLTTTRVMKGEDYRFETICQSDAAWKKESLTAGAAWKFSRPREVFNRSTSMIFTFVKSPLWRRV
ncbi:hypothetical protein F2Q69_00058067 [Brassica cretica]|uniref:Uncharacterized protein n=1 Tax=Brassica cretica TaxID=69181 RepID=A0A8S9N8D4_BRACR|nr:hypothetical protein F2Q69_00058067 [Brassica cretica]